MLAEEKSLSRDCCRRGELWIPHPRWDLVRVRDFEVENSPVAKAGWDQRGIRVLAHLVCRKTLTPLQNEHGISQLIIQSQWFVQVIPEVTDLQKLQLRNRFQQSSKLICPIDSQLMVRRKSENSMGSCDFQAEANGFDSSPTTEIENTNRGRHASFSASHSPAFTILFIGIGRKQMKAQKIHSTGTQTRGHTLQMSACGIFSDQMPKRIDEAMGKINGPVEPKVCHVTTEDIGSQSFPVNPTLGVSHTGVIQVKGCDVQSSPHKFNNLPPAAAANLQYGRTICAQELLSNLLYEIGLRNSFIAERQIPVPGSIVAIRQPELTTGPD